MADQQRVPVVIEEKKSAGGALPYVILAIGALGIAGGIYIYVKKSKPSLPIDQLVQKQSVTYNNDDSRVAPGQKLSVQIVFKNIGTSSIKPRFRVDIKGTGAGDTPLEGHWVASTSVDAGKSAKVNVDSIPIPTDWGDGKQFKAYVMLEGLDGHWDEASIVFIVTLAGTISKTSVVYNDGKTQVTAGLPISVKITWKNTGTGPFQPRFRVDIEGTGLLDSPLEGQWVTSPSVAAGQSTTVTAQSIPVPTDWGAGKQLHAYVMLEGVGGHWDSSGIMTVSGGAGAGAVSKTSVVYNNGQTQVNAGSPVSVQITWKNTGTAAIQPRFRVDIQGTGLLDSPLEGQWVTSPSVAAGQSTTVTAQSIPVPTDWGAGKQFNAYVMLEGINGHWDTSALLTISGGAGAGAVSKVSVVYNNGQTQVNAGSPVSVQITWKNTGTAAIQPRFRVDIQGTGLLDSPLEGQWVASPSVAAGQSTTVTAQSIQVPADWGAGKQLNAYVMLEGVNGHWDTSALLTISGGAGAGAVSKTSVVYNNGQTQVNAGSPVSVQITWKNTGTAAIQPRFRVDIQGTGLLDSPLEGQWVTSPSVAAGQSTTVTAQSIPVPTDWGAGKQLHAYVMLEGVNGHWDTSTLLTVGGAGAVPTLSASFSNGTVGFAFSGFHPNSTVTIMVEETSGYVNMTSDSNGSGSGAFADGDPPGPYTLMAYDNYGNVDTATFVVTVALYNFKVTIINAGSAFTGATQWLVYYYDTVLNEFVGDDTWHSISEAVSFSQAHSGGWLAIFLYNSSTGQMSDQITTAPFVLFGNDVLQYDAATGNISGA